MWIIQVLILSIALFLTVQSAPNSPNKNEATKIETVIKDVKNENANEIIIPKENVEISRNPDLHHEVPSIVSGKSLLALLVFVIVGFSIGKSKFLFKITPLDGAHLNNSCVICLLYTI